MVIGVILECPLQELISSETPNLRRETRFRLFYIVHPVVLVITVIIVIKQSIKHNSNNFLYQLFVGWLHVSAFKKKKKII
jgi:hypothetical protein